MTTTSGGEGWWLASDGNWYPPETHPDRQQGAPAAGAAVHPPAGPIATDFFFGASSGQPGVSAAPTYQPDPRYAQPRWATSTPAPVATGPAGLQLASLGARAGAYLIDWMVLAAIGFVAVRFLTLHRTQTSAFPATQSGPPIVVLVLIGLAVSLAYFAVLDGWFQTLGKRVVGLAVRDELTGRPVGIGRAFLRRFVFDALFGLFLVPGIAYCIRPLMDPKGQALHDKAGRSVVVQVKT